MIGLAIGVITYAACGMSDEYPLEDPRPSVNMLIFLIGYPWAGAFLGMLIDSVSPASVRARVASGLLGLGCGVAISALMFMTEGLDNAVPESVAPFGLLVGLVMMPAIGVLLAHGRVRTRPAADAPGESVAWSTHRSRGGMIGLVLAIGLFVLISQNIDIVGDGTLGVYPLDGGIGEYALVLVGLPAGLSALGAGLGTRAEAAGTLGRSELTVDMNGLSIARPGRGTSVAVAWGDLERVELWDGRIVGWYLDHPDTAAWANRHGLPLHAMGKGGGGAPPQASYVLFDSGLHPDRHGEAGSLHRLDEALRAFGGDRYR